MEWPLPSLSGHPQPVAPMGAGRLAQLHGAGQPGQGQPLGGRGRGRGVEGSSQGSLSLNCTIHHTHGAIWLTGTHPDSCVAYAQGGDAWGPAAAGVALGMGADRAEGRCFKCKRNGTKPQSLFVCDGATCMAAPHRHYLPKAHVHAAGFWAMVLPKL